MNQKQINDYNGVSSARVELDSLRWSTDIKKLYKVYYRLARLLMSDDSYVKRLAIASIQEGNTIHHKTASLKALDSLLESFQDQPENVLQEFHREYSTWLYLQNNTRH